MAPADPHLRHAALLQSEVHKVLVRLRLILLTSIHLCEEARHTRATAQRIRKELRRRNT